MTIYLDPMFLRLEPRTVHFKAGRITETDVLTLAEAARFASVHAGTEVTPTDFLRAAGRGEITLRAIVHRTAKLQKIGGGVYCNAGQPNENTAPSGSILNLPQSACNQLSAAGRASWRTFDGFEIIDGSRMRYTAAELMPDEPDFETTPDDCRVTGNAVHALADAFTDEPAPATATAMPAPVVVTDWRNAVRAEAWEKWVKTLAENGTPTLENVSAYLAGWCDANQIMTDTGKTPKSSYLKIHVIDGKHWNPPRNMSREAAKKHLEQKEHAKQAN